MASGYSISVFLFLLGYLLTRRVLVRRADGSESVEMIENDLGLNPRDHNAVLSRLRAQDSSITGASLYSGIKDGKITDSNNPPSPQTRPTSRTFQSSITFGHAGAEESKQEVGPVRIATTVRMCFCERPIDYNIAPLIPVLLICYSAEDRCAPHAAMILASATFSCTKI